MADLQIHPYIYEGRNYKWKIGVRAAAGIASGVKTAWSIGTGTSAVYVFGGGVAAATLVGPQAALTITILGAVFTVSAAAAAVVSSAKSYRHSNALNVLQDERQKLRDFCQDPDGGIHDRICGEALTYLIKQKMEKSGRKAASITGLESLYAMGRSAYKSYKGTKGIERMMYAELIGEHLYHCDCTMAKLIVAELYSLEETYHLQHDYQPNVPESKILRTIADTIFFKSASR